MCTQRTGSETPSPLHPWFFFFYFDSAPKMYYREYTLVCDSYNSILGDLSNLPQ